jgi:hypothetical protein
VTSDGATGLLGFVGRVLWWVNHQRCVFHIWRGLGGEFARRTAEAAQGLAGEAAEVARKAARRELVSLVRAVVDARSEAEAQLALGRLRAHRLGKGLGCLRHPGRGASRRRAGVSESLQSGAAPSGAGVGLAGLPTPSQSGAQPRVGCAIGAGGPGLAGVLQLRTRSMEVREEEEVRTTRQELPGDGWGTAGESQLPGCSERLSAQSPLAAAQKATVR